MSDGAPITQQVGEGPDASPDGADARAVGRDASPIDRRWITLGIVGVLTALAISTRVSGVGPSSLFLDDAWVAYVSKVGYGDLGMMGLTSPGFLALQKIWFDVVGFSEVRAQALPFLASVATPGAAYLTLRRAIRPELAAAAGVVVAFTSLNVKYSFHVKQYTIEVLAGFVIFYLTWRWIVEPSRRNLWLAIGAMCLAAAFSFLVIVLATGPIAVIALRSLRAGRRQIVESGAAIGAWGLFALVWYLGVIKPNASDVLETFWSDFYLETEGSFLDLVASLRDRTWDLFESLTPFPPAIVAVVMTITFVAALLRRTDWAIMATVPLVAAAVLAGMERAPLGGGRTDNYLLVPLLVGFIVGVDALVDIIGEALARRQFDLGPKVLGMSSAAIIAGLSIGGYETPDPYPQNDVRPLVDDLEALREPGDVLLLYYGSVYAYALYADVESKPIDAGTPYYIEFDEPDLIVQRGHRTDPSQYLQYAEEALDRSDRVWLLASHYCSCDWGEINRQLRYDLALETEYVHERPGASLQLWVPRS